MSEEEGGGANELGIGICASSTHRWPRPHARTQAEVISRIKGEQDPSANADGIAIKRETEVEVSLDFC
jgi:hypothetical protein